MSEALVTTRRHGPVLEIRLSSPKSRNSLTEPLREALGDAVKDASLDRSVRVVLLTAEGQSFCAGGDLFALQKACDPWPVHRRFRKLDHWLSPLITLDRPVVVAVNGHAVGGGMGLALTGDVLIAGESAKFMAGFFRLGAIPDIATMYTLPRLVGMAQAKRILFNNLSLSAQEAAAIGLVSRVVPDEELHQSGLAEAQRLAAGPAEVMGLAKIMMARSFESSLGEMLAFEGFGQALAMSNPEFREGLNAAVEKRPADFMAACEREIAQQREAQ